VLYEQLAPLERANAHIESLLDHWSDASFAAPASGDTESLDQITLEPLILAHDAVECIAATLQHVSSLSSTIGSLQHISSSIDSALTLAAVQSVRQLDVACVSDELANLKHRADRLYDLLEPLEAFLQTDASIEVPLHKIQIPVFYCRKQLIDEMIEVDRVLLESATADTAASIRDEMAYLSQIVAKWDRRKAVIKKRDIWQVPLRVRNIALDKLEPEHLRAYHVQRASIKCRIEIIEHEFRMLLVKQLADAICHLRWGMYFSMLIVLTRVSARVYV
jgi:hypothetical protein